MRLPDNYRALGRTIREVASAEARRYYRSDKRDNVQYAMGVYDIIRTAVRHAVRNFPGMTDDVYLQVDAHDVIIVAMKEAGYVIPPELLEMCLDEDDC
jgi:hypothetical protein